MHVYIGKKFNWAACGNRVASIDLMYEATIGFPTKDFDVCFTTNLTASNILELDDVIEKEWRKFYPDSQIRRITRAK